MPDGEPPNNNIFIGDLPMDVTEEQMRQVFGAYGTMASCKLLPGQKNNKSALLIRFENLEEAVWIKENLNGGGPQGLETPVFVNYNNRAGKGSKGKDSGMGAMGKGWSPYDMMGKGKGMGKDMGKEMMMMWGGWGGPPWGMDKGKGKGKYNIKGLKKGLMEANALPGGKYMNDENAIYVKGLPIDTSDLDLYHIFSSFGAIPAFGCRAMLHEDGSCKGFGFVNFKDQSASQTAIMTLNGTQLPDGSTLQVSVKQDKAAKTAGPAPTLGANAGAGPVEPGFVDQDPFRGMA